MHSVVGKYCQYSDNNVLQKRLFMRSQYIYENLVNSYAHKNIINLFKKYSGIHDINTMNTILSFLKPGEKSMLIYTFYNIFLRHIQDLSINKFKSFILRNLCQKAFNPVKEYL